MGSVAARDEHRELMQRNGIPEIGPGEAAERLSAGVAVLDVREPDEWAAGRIAGAIHIPVGELVARQDEIPEDVFLIAVCRSGARSAFATEMLVRAGYEAANLVGGLQAWDAAGLPLEPDGAYVA